MARRALILANSHYADETIPALASPVSDALRLKTLLEREEIGGYQVTVCNNEETMAARMAVHDFFQAALPGDLHLMVYSGHGLKDARSRLYFATADTQRDRLAATALSASYIRQQIDDSRAGQKLLFIDACYSGTFIEGMTPKRVGEMQVSPSDFGNPDDKGTAIVTASTSVQLAGEREFDGTVQSVFTRCLIEGIETGQADASGDGMITVMELFDYVRERMRTEAPGQTPHVLSLGNGVSMPVARNPMHRKVALPKVLLALARSKDRVERGSAVEDLEELAASGAPEASLALDLLGSLASDDSLTVRGFAEAALARLEKPTAPAKKIVSARKASPHTTSAKSSPTNVGKASDKANVDKLQFTQSIRTVADTPVTLDPSLKRLGWIVIAFALFAALWSVNFFFSAKNQTDSELYADATEATTDAAAPAADTAIAGEAAAAAEAAAEAAAAGPALPNWLLGTWGKADSVIGCAFPMTIRDNGNSTLTIQSRESSRVESYEVSNGGFQVATTKEGFTKRFDPDGTEEFIVMTTKTAKTKLAQCEVNEIKK